MEKYSLKEYNLKKYSFEKYSVGKYSLEKYSLEYFGVRRAQQQEAGFKYHTSWWQTLWSLRWFWIWPGLAATAPYCPGGYTSRLDPQFGIWNLKWDVLFKFTHQTGQAYSPRHQICFWIYFWFCIYKKILYLVCWSITWGHYEALITLLRHPWHAFSHKSTCGSPTCTSVWKGYMTCPGWQPDSIFFSISNPNSN